MSTSQLRILECAENAAREAAAGRVDIETAERIYRGARARGIDRTALVVARRYLSAARRASCGGGL